MTYAHLTLRDNEPGPGKLAHDLKPPNSMAYIRLKVTPNIGNPTKRPLGNSYPDTFNETRLETLETIVRHPYGTVGTMEQEIHPTCGLEKHLIGLTP